MALKRGGVTQNLTSTGLRKFLKGEGLSVKDSKAFIKRALVRPGISVSIADGSNIPSFSVRSERN